MVPDICYLGHLEYKYMVTNYEMHIYIILISETHTRHFLYLSFKYLLE